MNTIGWFLYAVDVIGSLNVVLSFLMILLVVASIALAIFAIINKSMSKTYPELSQSKNEAKRADAAFALLPKLVVITVLVGLLTIITPSQKTMYLIMASEVGEEVVMSETGQRVQSAINKKLDEYLGEVE